MTPRWIHWCIAAVVVANVVVYYQGLQPEARLPDNGPEGLRDLMLLSELKKPLALRTVQRPWATEEYNVAAPSSAEAAPQASAEPPDTGEVASLYSDTTADRGSGDSTTTEPLPPFESEAADQATSTAVVAEVATTVQPPRRCWLAGPVTDGSVSEELAAEFAAAGVSLDLVLQTVAAPPDYWVYLPTSGEQADVRRLSRELRQEGVDNFPITDGRLAGGLSVGLFRSEQGAGTLRDQLRARGYQAEIYARDRYRDEAWVALDDAARELLRWPDEAGEIKGQAASLQLVERDCEASEPSG